MTNRIGQSPSNNWGLSWGPLGAESDRARLQGNIANIPNPAAQNRAPAVQNQPTPAQNSNVGFANQDGTTR